MDGESIGEELEVGKALGVGRRRRPGARTVRQWRLRVEEALEADGEGRGLVRTVEDDEATLSRASVARVEVRDGGGARELQVPAMANGTMGRELGLMGMS